jgi:hypothetical protein
MGLLALIFQNTPGCLLAEVEHQGFCPRNLVLLNHHNDPEASIGPMLLPLLLQSADMGAVMDSRSRFAALEAACRDRAALAKKEMDYWLSEASEWKQLREASDASEPETLVQLDWCAIYDAQVAAG